MKEKTALQRFRDEVMMGVDAFGMERGFIAYLNGKTACKILEEEFKEMGMNLEVRLTKEDGDQIFMVSK